MTGLLLGAFSFSAAAASPPVATPHPVYDQVITFKRGTSDLTKLDKDSLANLFQKLKDRSQKVEQIHVAAWSDQAMKNPELAARRADAIQDQLEGVHTQSYVETYNMAERTNWFAKAMNANAKEIKAMFAQKGAPQNVTPEDFGIVRSKGGLSKAVILIELESATMMDQ